MGSKKIIADVKPICDPNNITDTERRGVFSMQIADVKFLERVNGGAGLYSKEKRLGYS